MNVYWVAEASKGEFGRVNGMLRVGHAEQHDAGGTRGSDNRQHDAGGTHGMWNAGMRWARSWATLFAESETWAPP